MNIDKCFLFFTFIHVFKRTGLFKICWNIPSTVSTLPTRCHENNKNSPQCHLSLILLLLPLSIFPFLPQGRLSSQVRGQNGITPHSSTVNFNTLHYTTSHNTTLHFSSLHYDTVHFNTIHYTSVHFNTLHYSSVHFNKIRYTTVHFNTLHYTTVHFKHYKP